MKLERYVVIQGNSGTHNAVAYCDVDSYVYVAEQSCSLDDVAGAIAADEAEPESAVRQRIQSCNAGLDSHAVLRGGALLRVKTEKTPSDESVLDEIPMAGGKYLKFLKWAIGGVKWAAEKVEGGPDSDAKSRWQNLLAVKRSEILSDHRAILNALSIPVEENSFEKVINKVIPDFLRKKGFASNLLQFSFSRDGYLVMRYQHTRIVTSTPVDRYA